METFINILSYLPIVEAVPYLLLYNGVSVIRMLKTKSSNDVSIFAWTVATVIHTCYIFYGFLIVGEWQYIASCFCAASGHGAVLITALYYRYKAKRKKMDSDEER